MAHSGNHFFNCLLDVISADDGEGVFLWDAATPGKPLVSRDAHSGMVEALALRGETIGRVALGLAPIHLLLGGLPLV